MTTDLAIPHSISPMVLLFFNFTAAILAPGSSPTRHYYHRLLSELLTIPPTSPDSLAKTFPIISNPIANSPTLSHCPQGKSQWLSVANMNQTLLTCQVLPFSLPKFLPCVNYLKVSKWQCYLSPVFPHTGPSAQSILSPSLGLPSIIMAPQTLVLGILMAYHIFYFCVYLSTGWQV